MVKVCHMREAGIKPKLRRFALRRDRVVEMSDHVSGQRERGTIIKAWIKAGRRFQGRIRRDDWVGQAKALASGEETDFSQRAKKAISIRNNILRPGEVSYG